jgi:hypothetical protein
MRVTFLMEWMAGGWIIAKSGLGCNPPGSFLLAVCQLDQTRIKCTAIMQMQMFLF